MNPALDDPLIEILSSIDQASGRSITSSLRHSVFQSFDELGNFGEEWDAFVKKCDGDLYSSLDWCRIWWKHYGDGRKLEVHIFRIDAQIIGLIPAFRETLWVGPVPIRLIRLLGCDHLTTTCGIVIEPAHIDAVIALFSQWLAQESTWDAVQWSPLAGYFQNREAITDSFKRHGDTWRVQSSGQDGPHIIWELPGSFDEYLAGLSKKERSNIKIGRKKLADDAFISSLASTPGELPKWFPIFVEQHQQQWKVEGKLGHFADWPVAESFHRDLAARMAVQDRLWLLRLDVGEDPIGFQYNYRFGRRIHWLLGSRDIDPKWDPYGVGRTLHVETIERAIAEGFNSIDGLRGMYEYKLRLGGKVVGLQSITLVRRGFGPELRFVLSRVFAHLLDLFYYRIWFSRIAPKLPLRRRGLWKLWIRSRI